MGYIIIFYCRRWSKYVSIEICKPCLTIQGRLLLLLPLLPRLRLRQQQQQPRLLLLLHPLSFKQRRLW